MKAKEAIACYACAISLGLLFIVTKDATCLALGVVAGWVPAMVGD
jgi:hypothetical protein